MPQEPQPIETDALELEPGGEGAIVKDVGRITKAQVRGLEEAAGLIESFQRAMYTIMVKATYPSDWIIQGETACLKSAGAERIASALGDFEWREVRPASKEKIDDKHGTGYIWTYYYRVTWRGRSVDAIGHYSSRDLLLGKVGDDFRDVADINEANIMRAARHIAIGEGIKQILGLRGMPVDLMPRFGKSPTDMKKVERDVAPKDQNKHRKQLTSMLLALNENNQDAAIAALEEVTAFKGKKGPVPGVKATAQLTGDRLRVTFDIVRRTYEERFGPLAETEPADEST